MQNRMNRRDAEDAEERRRKAKTIYHRGTEDTEKIRRRIYCKERWKKLPVLQAGTGNGILSDPDL